MALGQGRLVRQDLVCVAPVCVGNPDVGSGPPGGEVRDLCPVGREGRFLPLRDPNRLAAAGVDDEQARGAAIVPGGEDDARPVGRDRRAICVLRVPVQLSLGPIRAEDVEVVGTAKPLVSQIFTDEQHFRPVARPAERLGARCTLAVGVGGSLEARQRRGRGLRVRVDGPEAGVRAVDDPTREWREDP